LSSIVFADWLFFALVAGSLFVFRKRIPGAERPYVCPLYPIVPIIFLVLASAMVVVTLATSPTWTSRFLGAGILLSGVPVYALFRARTRRAGTQNP
jgi:APA family basic amino acid/polyamine antiporter